ncbi:hypothetical protein (nucleomorph) [Guillardia theta]|uniref:Brix domain-containing protein n=1 Tax=Guillardia theta TaxID=55529 RepID=Q98RV0_GUITH|nr:hypothetical protein GTHECHR1057 [Guillardia theta]AAK39849.1 hypothetical protein [Guillardia theta]|mmetsp:Transcript_16957/g.56172  ORF Transcript_16957/g.56172 Transcript_16957/m.56172 type:complete len:225 (-) Transcript_16957:905-1579(-)
MLLLINNFKKSKKLFKLSKELFHVFPGKIITSIRLIEKIITKYPNLCKFLNIQTIFFFSCKKISFFFSIIKPTTGLIIIFEVFNFSLGIEIHRNNFSKKKNKNIFLIFSNSINNQVEGRLLHNVFNETFPFSEYDFLYCLTKSKLLFLNYFEYDLLKHSYEFRSYIVQVSYLNISRKIRKNNSKNLLIKHESKLDLTHKIQGKNFLIRSSENGPKLSLKLVIVK